MAACNPFQEISTSSKPLFMAMYATVALGILFSSLFILSALYSSPNKPFFSSTPPLQNVDGIGLVNTSNMNVNINHGIREGNIIWDAPVGSEIPDLKVFRLTKEMVQNHTKNNVVIVTFGNYAFMDFILNWVRHLTDLNVFNLLVVWKLKVTKREYNGNVGKFPALAVNNLALFWMYDTIHLDLYVIKHKYAQDHDMEIKMDGANHPKKCWIVDFWTAIVGNFLQCPCAMDTKLLEALYWKGVPVFDMGSNMNTVDVGWGSPTFHKMGREKVLLINALMPFGVELLMCDTDMVWLKNPLPYLARFPEADVLTSSDQIIPTVTDDSLEVWQQVSGAYNIGIFHWRPTDASKKLAKEWKDMLLADETIWDQTGFNELVHKTLGPSVVGENGPVYAFDGKLKLGILPASIFCSGHTYFVQAMHQQFRLEPYAVHTTFQYAGTEGKRHRLREAMFFHDPPEYYDSLGGFLSFKPSIPKSLLLDGLHTIESHFFLVNYQLKQIRTALAIALLLNRTLVMPPLWCRFDRMWFGHPGIMEGTITRQPFLCPMDHVFEVNVMLKGLPEAEFGTQIDFREYSFLQNPRVSKQVKDSFLEVKLCDEQYTKCHVTNETTRRGILRLPKNSSQETFIEVFSSYKDVKVIQFSSMEDAFRGFTDKERETKFRNRVKRYVGIWCCVQSHDPGHIYYDMYWDEKPGWKPEPPKTREDDQPPW